MKLSPGFIVPAFNRAMIRTLSAIDPRCTGTWGALALVMVVVFLLGFILEAIEIIYIVVPLLGPPVLGGDISPVWFGVLLAMNLQTSFLTPPFGFSLFYLKGVAPPEVRTTDIYKGVLPFILIQMFVLALIVIFPEWFGMSSSY